MRTSSKLPYAVRCSGARSGSLCLRSESEGPPRLPQTASRHPTRRPTSPTPIRKRWPRSSSGLRSRTRSRLRGTTSAAGHRLHLQHQLVGPLLRYVGPGVCHLPRPLRPTLQQPDVAALYQRDRTAPGAQGLAEHLLVQAAAGSDPEGGGAFDRHDPDQHRHGVDAGQRGAACLCAGPRDRPR
jgi:hypothetical protein